MLPLLRLTVTSTLACVRVRAAECLVRLGLVDTAKVDLHVHTRASLDRWETVLPLGIPLRGTFRPALSPSETFDLALSRGMTHVTFTDHDSILGWRELLRLRPECERWLIPGEEVTVLASPGLHVHVNVWGLTEDDHEEIHRHARSSSRSHEALCNRLPDLVGYLRDRGLPYALNHLLWAPEQRLLTWQRIDDLLSHFDLFEGRNGNRGPRLNTQAVRLIELMRGPVSYVAGSDSHTSHVGLTYTILPGSTVDDVLESLRQGRTTVAGDMGSRLRLFEETLEVISSNARTRLGPAYTSSRWLLSRLPRIEERLGRWWRATVAGGVQREVEHRQAYLDSIEEQLFGAYGEAWRAAEAGVDPMVTEGSAVL